MYFKINKKVIKSKENTSFQREVPFDRRHTLVVVPWNTC
jgi:hypothetical protein